MLRDYYIYLFVTFRSRHIALRSHDIRQLFQTHIVTNIADAKSGGPSKLFEPRSQFLTSYVEDEDITIDLRRSIQILNGHLVFSVSSD